MFIKSTPPLIQCEILLQYVMLRVEKLQKGTNEHNLVAPAPRSWYIYLQACQFCMITKLKKTNWSNWLWNKENNWLGSSVGLLPPPMGMMPPPPPPPSNQPPPPPSGPLPPWQQQAPPPPPTSSMATSTPLPWQQSKTTQTLSETIRSFTTQFTLSCVYRTLSDGRDQFRHYLVIFYVGMGGISSSRYRLYYILYFY